jgi:dTMP kinase
MKKESTFVVLEGVDAVGKTSLAKQIQKIMGSEKVALISEFPTSFLDGYLERLVKTSPDLQLNENISTPLTQTAVLAGAALYKYESEVRQLIQQDKQLIIMDRYIYSVAAYQKVALQNMDKEVATKANDLLASLLKIVPPPDMVIYLNLPIDIITERIQARGEPTAPEYIKFLKDVKHSYDKVLKNSEVKYYEFIANNGLENDASSIVDIIYSKDSGNICLLNSWL